MINKTPKHWQVKKLGEICEIFTGNSINASIKERDFTNLRDGLNYIATKDIGFDREINYENGVKIPLSKISKFKVAKSNSVLLCIEGGSAGKKLAFLKQDVCFVNKLCCLKFKGKNNSKILYYFLQSNDFLSKFYFNISGLIGGITKTALKEICIPLPPLDEQNLIVKKIESCFEKIDFAISNFKKSKELIEIYKQSVLSHAFNGKLTNSNLNSWQVKKLGEICEIVSGGTPNTGNKNFWDDEFNASSIFWATLVDTKSKYIYGTKRKITQLGLQSSSARILPVNSVLFSSRATIGNVCVAKVELCTNQGFKNFICQADELHYEFLYYFLNFAKIDIENLAKGTTYKEISKTNIENIKIPLPNLQTQAQIVSQIEKRFKSADSVLNLIEQNLKKAEILKQSILSKAFNGELVKG